jgi:hypothetical protein
MNTKFVAAALIIIDQYLQDVDFEDFENYFKVLKTGIFSNEKIMNKFLDNLIDKFSKKENTENLAKIILFNYIYKIAQFRVNSKPEIGKDEYKQKAPELEYPNIAKNVV